MNSDKFCIDFENIDNISVNCVVGFGLTCRTAQSLKRNNLRLFSSPFDWMLNFSLDDVIYMLENKGEPFFADCYEDRNYSSDITRGIVDKKTGTISMHDFPKNLPVEQAPEFFRRKFKPKFQFLDFVLNSAKTICIITNREIQLEEMEDFIAKLTNIYTFDHIYHINIYDCPEESFQTIQKGNATYMIYYFNDEHKDGRDSTVNPLFWLGKTDYWDKILQKISIV